MKGSYAPVSLKRSPTIHSEPSVRRDLISGLMAELPSANTRKVSVLSQSAQETASEELLILRKVQLVVEKVELVVRAWTKERGTGMQSLILGVRKVLERELRKELMARQLGGGAKDWGSQDYAYSVEKDLTPRGSGDSESGKSAFGRGKLPAKPPSNFKRSSTSASESCVLLLTDSVKHYLAATQHQVHTLTPKSAKAKQELTSRLNKLEEQLTGTSVQESVPIEGLSLGSRPANTYRVEQERAIIRLSEELITAESGRWSQVEASLNGVFAKVVELLGRLQSAKHEQLQRRKTLRQASSSNLTELQGEVKSLKQLLETCMPSSPRLQPSLSCVNCSDLQEKLLKSEYEVTILQVETARLHDALQGYGEDKWGEMQVETVRLASQLEVAASERDQANALIQELQSDAELRQSQALLMLREDYCSAMQRVLASHYQETKALHWRIWELEEGAASIPDIQKATEGQSPSVKPIGNGRGKQAESIKSSDYA